MSQPRPSGQLLKWSLQCQFPAPQLSTGPHQHQPNPVWSPLILALVWLNRWCLHLSRASLPLLFVHRPVCAILHLFQLQPHLCRRCVPFTSLVTALSSAVPGQSRILLSPLVVVFIRLPPLLHLNSRRQVASHSPQHCAAPRRPTIDFEKDEERAVPSFSSLWTS